MGCGLSSHGDTAPDGSTPEAIPSFGAIRSLGYEPDEVLGEGAFGEVVLVEDKVTLNEYACKKLKQEHVNESFLETEVAILKLARHPNIVFLREASVAASDIFLILELARGGSLLGRIQSEYSSGMPESYAASVIIQLASALEYLHRERIVHRDMKPENVLMLDASPRSLVKLCDFGLSKMYTETSAAAASRATSKEVMMRSRVGSQFYASPELLLERAYSASIDLWGLGHILFQCVTGHHAFEDSIDTFGDATQARVDYSHAAFTKFPDARALCLTLLCAEPLERPTPSEVLSHPWLRAAVSRDRRINLSLRYLGRVSSVRSICLRCLESVLPMEKRNELWEQFNALDSDQKGYLNGGDVRRAIKPPKRHGRHSHSHGSAHSSRRSSWAVSERESDGGKHDNVQSAVSEDRASRASVAGVAAADILRRLLQNALADTGVGRGSQERRGSAHRKAQGARRVGVVTFSMFVEAALEGDKPLVRRLWSKAFEKLDGDGDGNVSDSDLAGCLHTLGIELPDDSRKAMLSDEPNGSSKWLLRLVLKGEHAARTGSVTRLVPSETPSAAHLHVV